MGSARWLQQLLDVLEGKADAPDQPINPFQAVNIDPLFAVEHPPLIEREMWVDVNVVHVRNMGAQGWLRQAAGCARWRHRDGGGGRLRAAGRYIRVRYARQVSSAAAGKKETEKETPHVRVRCEHGRRVSCLSPRNGLAGRLRRVHSVRDARRDAWHASLLNRKSDEKEETMKSLDFLKQVDHSRKAAIYAAAHDGKMRNFAYHEELGECRETFSRLLHACKRARSG